eukprot:2842545-Prymnesium_polylepis.2
MLVQVADASGLMNATMGATAAAAPSMHAFFKEVAAHHASSEFSALSGMRNSNLSIAWSKKPAPFDEANTGEAHSPLPLKTAWNEA